MISLALALGRYARAGRSRQAAWWSAAMLILAVATMLAGLNSAPLSKLGSASRWLAAGMALNGAGWFADRSNRRNNAVLTIITVALAILTLASPSMSQRVLTLAASLAVLSIALVPDARRELAVIPIGAALVMLVPGLSERLAAFPDVIATAAGVALLTNVGERRIARLQHQALSDELTGLANLRAFRQAGARAIARLNRQSTEVVTTSVVLIADLDDFKLINDLAGHEVGDRVLICYATMLCAQLRKEDMVARIGGDEFGILLNNTPVSAIDQVIKRLVQAAKELHVAGVTAHIRASFGSSAITAGDVALTDAMQRADRELYRAKRRRTY